MTQSFGCTRPGVASRSPGPAQSDAAGQLVHALPTTTAFATLTQPQFSSSTLHTLCKWGNFRWMADHLFEIRTGERQKWKMEGGGGGVGGVERRGCPSALKWFDSCGQGLTLISLHFNNENYDCCRGPITNMQHSWWKKECGAAGTADGQSPSRRKWQRNISVCLGRGK